MTPEILLKKLFITSFFFALIGILLGKISDHDGIGFEIAKWIIILSVVSIISVLLTAFWVLV